MTRDYAYQPVFLDNVDKAHETVTRVCGVSPTGSGKSVMGRQWARRLIDGGLTSGLMLAHRLELLRQMQKHFAAVGIQAGIISPEEPAQPWLPVQCASLDTLVSRGEVPRADWILVDECHHILAETWKPVIESQPWARVLGLTATPQRGDGRPLGDVFQSMVVAERYSALLRGGYLVPVRVFRPGSYLGGDFARDPCEAWLTHSAGKRGFAFCRSLADSKDLAERLCAAGVRATNIDGQLATKERTRRMDAFAAGDIDVLTNMGILTEGIDVPDAEVVMLAKNIVHVGAFMQAGGRGLRPSAGKTELRLIDLPGLTHLHGLPTQDRDYSLDGRPMTLTGESLRVCPECGCTCPSAVRACIECGVVFPRREYKGPKIWNMELMEYFENVGELHTAPKPLKRLEWERLVEVCERRSFGIGFAVQEFEKIFQERPDEFAKALPEEMRVAELKRLRQIQQTKGLKDGWISHAYRGTFGAFPSRALRETAGVPVPSEGGRAW